MLKPVHILLAVLVSVIWGFNFVVIKVGVAEVPPLLLTGLRFTFAALPAVFFVKRPTAHWTSISAFGFVLGVVKFGLLFVAIHQGLTASLASLVLQLQAFFTIVIATVILRERPKPIQILGAAVALSGIGVIAASRWSGPELLPLALAVASAIAWGFANIISKTSGEKNMLSYVVWSSLVAPVPLFALSWALEDHAAITKILMHPTLIAAGAVAYLAWPVTIVGFAVWNFLLSKYPTSTVAPFSLLVPIFGIASGVMILREPFGAAAIAGGTLIVLGLILNTFGPRWFAHSKNI
jgi:O-acetylserine/cysteine efflux transporter